MNDGDWICSDPNCGNINFARRVSCYRCNKERPDTSKAFKKKLGTEIGKTAAEKSRGLFNADDWQCNKCANVNWARRQTCNVCNAPKYGEVEARTGYGGGYNERGVVEYRRREPSSDDEYDEFGRKKRKRKPDSEERERPEKVGITEGAVFKNLPPTVLQKESNKEHNMPVFGPNLSMNTSDTSVKRNGSLSDGSMCELPSLTKAAVSRYQQLNNSRQDYMLPNYKKNGAQSRKRILSSSDKDQSCSSGYEGNSKMSKRENKHSPIPKMCNPVMENSVSSTKTEMVFKLNKANAAEDLQVSYTLEERVKCAALAIVYNNCKITADKFESIYEKPAPDFTTIFEWRQKLMTKGCLNDSHLDTGKSVQTNTATNTDNTNTQTPKIVCKIPNPDEIIIPSESEEDEYSKEKSERSMSIETVCIEGNTDLQAASRSASTVDGRGSRARSCSQSTHQRTRSNSRDSQDSPYPDTDSDKGAKSVNTNNTLKSSTISVRQSVHGSDSESVSYYSGEDNFLSRVFGEGRKRRKVKKRTVPAAVMKHNEYVSNDVNTFEGYSTLKKSQQSPLVTGNIYTNNLRNMNSRPRENVDIEGCSSEYVPTKIGSTAKKNYQEFKDNVRKKGYWAKGNGSSLNITRHNMSMNVIHQTKDQVIEEPVKSVSSQPSHQNATIFAKPVQNQATNFTRLETSTNSYLPFDIPIQTVKNTSIKDKTSENTDRIFAQVQSNNVSKNKSILDIFDTSDLAQKSPERKNDLDKYDNIRRMYENEWDEDDEALYKNTDCDEGQTEPRRASSATISNRTQSPTSDMLYTTEKDSQQGTSENSIPDFIKDKHDLLLDMLKDFQNKEISQMVSPLKHGAPLLQSAEDNNVYHKSIADAIPNIPMPGFEPVPDLPANRSDSMSNLLMTRLDTIPNPVMARPERFTNPVMTRFDHETSPNLTVKRSDSIPKYPKNRHSRAPKSIKRSEIISNNNENRLDPIPSLLMPEVSPISKPSMTSPDRVSNLTMNRSDLTPNLMTRPEPSSNPSRSNLGSNHTSLPDFTQNVTPNRPEPIAKPSPNLCKFRADRVPNQTMARPDLNPILTMNTPEPIPIELSNEVLHLADENVSSEVPQDVTKTISPKKRVHILENITIQPGSVHQNIAPLKSKNQPSSPNATQTNTTKFVSSSPKVDEKQATVEKTPEKEQPVSQVDLSNLLAGINTNTLLLALQNLQQISQSSSPKCNEEKVTEQQSTEEPAQVAETAINLTNDEEWEKESNRDGSIERQLEQMDGSTGDTPFLSDIFDPGPVVVPPNIVRKLNLNIPTLEGDGADTNSNENAPVIGNFKSFALPKPILLNRLKLTVKTAEKPAKSSGKRVKRKNKSKPSAAPAPGQPEPEEDEDDESGDEADLSKYDLWGSDGEQGNSSKTENAEKTKDGEGGKDKPGADDNDKVSPNNKSKRRLVLDVGLGAPPHHRARLRVPVLVTVPQLLKTMSASRRRRVASRSRGRDRRGPKLPLAASHGTAAQQERPGATSHRATRSTRATASGATGRAATATSARSGATAARAATRAAATASSRRGDCAPRPDTVTHRPRRTLVQL